MRMRRRYGLVLLRRCEEDIGGGWGGWGGRFRRSSSDVRRVPIHAKEFTMSAITIEKSSCNVYADLGLAGAQEMLIKAKLASKIGEIIQRQNLTQQQAALLLAMPQPKVSLLLRGQFRGISEAKMLECLARLGRDIDIVLKPARRRALSGTVGRVNVVFG